MSGREGERDDCMYFIASGGCSAQADRTGIRRFFGEIALLEEVPRTATVQTIEPTTLLALARGQFFDLVETIPDLRVAFETMVMERRSDSS